MSLAVTARAPSPSELELLALVRAIYLYRKTGLVELETDRSDKHLYFVNGELYLQSSAPSARKIARLLRMQTWGDSRSQQALARLHAKIASRLSSWHTHAFRFREGQLVPFHDLVGPLPTAHILREAASEERALGRLKKQLNSDGVRIVASAPVNRPATASDDSSEADLLASLERPRFLGELLAGVNQEPSVAFEDIARLWATGLIREEPELSVRALEEVGVQVGDPQSAEGAEGPAPLAASFGGHESDSIWRQHFGLRREPFALTPDPAFLFVSEVHGEALAGLKLGLLERRGLLTLTGEVGTGKTTLLYALLSGLGPEIEAAYIYNTTLSYEEILHTALMDFGVTCNGSSRLGLLEALNGYLSQLAVSNRTAALVIDEAQNLSDETFEQLRLMLNFETFDRKLLQIVLVGQPELARRLAARQLRQIADRIAVRSALDPLSREEAERYVGHRLEAAGGTSRIFEPAALRLAVRQTRGIPRRINVICHNAMLFAFAAGERQVRKSFVREALRESRASTSGRLLNSSSSEEVGDSHQGGMLSRLRSLPGFAALVIAMGVLAGAGWYGLRSEKRPDATATSPAVALELAPGSRAARTASDPAASEPISEPASPADEPASEAPATQRPDVLATRENGPISPTGVTTENLHLRSGPSVDSSVLMVLPTGSEVSLLESRDEWLRVVVPNLDRVGWVSSLYVEESPGKRARAPENDPSVEP